MGREGNRKKPSQNTHLENTFGRKESMNHLSLKKHTKNICKTSPAAQQGNCRLLSLTAVTMILLLGIVLAGCINNRAEAAGMNEKAIIVASFGTSYEDTLKKTIAGCEDSIRSAFPDYKVIRAFTSNIIREILSERGMEIKSVDEALELCKESGVKTVMIQPLHVMPGEEFHEKILKPANTFSGDFTELVISPPLLHSLDDYDAVVNGLKGIIPVLQKDEAFVFMGHGTHHPSNATYSCLQLKLWEWQENILVGTVEGYPGYDWVLGELKKRSITKVTLMPFMIVAGDHAQNDMAGPEDDSWKSMLEAEGIEVSVSLTGLGEIEGVREIYINHIRDAGKQ
jgi:sirohydrochlorin cobaltochelatase